MNVEFKCDTSPVLVDSSGRVPMQAPLLTLAIPAYKHAQFIEECLSGLAQLDRKSMVELVLIDDCSPDDTALVAKSCLVRLGINFRLYRQNMNAGLTAALQFLLTEAKGRFVWFCASDDRPRRQALEKLLRDIVTSDLRGAAFAIYGASFFGDRSGPVYLESPLHNFGSDPRVLRDWLCTDFPRPLLLQSTIFRTAFLRDVNPWHTRLLLDDWPTFILSSSFAAEKKLPIQIELAEILVDYRVHAAGLHARWERQINACLETVDRVVPDTYKSIARSNVFAHASISYLSVGRLVGAVKAYIRCMRANPGISSVLLVPRLIAHVLIRRVRGQLMLLKSDN